VFERRVQGREIDQLVNNLPTSWPKRQTSDGEVPLVAPTIRTAAVDASGNPVARVRRAVTYVYDRTATSRGRSSSTPRGILAPSSLFFGRNNRVLVTPGLYEFEIGRPAARA
jgi:hypothetical protein